MLKSALKKAAHWLVLRPWLFFALIGLFWGLAIGGLVFVKNKIAKNEWNLPDFVSIPGDIVADFENQSIDWRFAWRGKEPGPKEIIVLQIGSSSLTGTICNEADFKTDPDLKFLEKWPYPRKAWAKIIEKLCASGAKVIGIDVIFATPSNFGVEDDIVCRDTIKIHENSLVLAATYKPGADDAGSELLLPNETLQGGLDDFKDMIGIANFDYTSGGTIRHTFSEIVTGQTQTDLYTFASLIAKKAGHQVPTRPEAFLINFAGGPESYKVIDLYKLFYSKTWNDELQKGKVFENKIVLIGASASAFQDFHNTPFGVMPGIIIHANVVSNYIDRPRLIDLDSWWLVIGSGVVQGLLLGFFRRPLSKLIPAVLVLVGIALLAKYLFIHSHLVVPLFMPWLVASMTSASVILWQGTSEFLGRQKTRKTLETYVSPNIAAYILQNQDAYLAARAGVRKPCTILFSDIRGFTTLTENSPDETKLVEHLNEYLTEMVHCVFEYGGTLHKFIGDAVMAVWGDTHSDGSKADALAAVMSALAMRRKLARLNEKWAGEGRNQLKIGIGLNHGTVVVGDIGSLESPQRLEYTVIGDAVNIASRVESETKAQGVDILISKSVHDLVRDDVDAESRGAITLKGKAEKVELFHLKGLRTR